MRGKLVTIFGGTGFIGSYLVPKLAARGAMVRIAASDVDAALILKTSGQVGLVEVVSCNSADMNSVCKAIGDSDYVVNLTGILVESRKRSFQKTHVEIPKIIAQACTKQKVTRFVHISAIGADPKAESRYAATKGQGEEEVRKGFPKATVLRPSVVFGAEDKFFNMFAEMSRTAPFLPLIAGGHTKLQPVYVGDVAEAIVRCLASGHEGQLYELGGPSILTFRELMSYVLQCTGRKCFFLYIPYSAALLMGSVMGIFPNPKLTRDQVKLTLTDNIVHEGEAGFSYLDIEPMSLEAIVPLYLERYRRH